MPVLPQTFGQRLHVFLQRVLGWYGLLFVPFLVFAQVSGRWTGQIPMTAVAIASLLGVAVALQLISESARPRFLLRPGSTGAGIAAFFLFGLFVAPIQVQVLLTLMGFDWAGVLSAARFDMLHDAAKTPRLSISGLSTAETVGLVIACFALIPIAIVNWTVAFMSLFVRFRVLQPRPVERRAQDPQPDNSAAPEERAAALRAMKKRMIQREQWKASLT